MARPRGRLRLHDFEVIELLASVATPKRLIGRRLGLSADRFEQLLANSPKARAAYADGKARLEGDLAGRLREMALDPATRNPVWVIAALKMLAGISDQPPVQQHETRVKVEFVNLPEPKTLAEYRAKLEARVALPAAVEVPAVLEVAVDAV